MITQETQTLAGQALVDAMIALDDAAWRKFLRDVGPLIGGLCRRAKLDEDEIEDIAQTVVLKLLDHNCRVLRQVRVDKDSLFHWIKVVISHTIVDYLRGSALRAQREARWTEGRKRVAGKGSNAVGDIEAGVDLERVIAGLSDEERTLFWLDYTDISDREIARILGLKLATAQQRLSRLKKKLIKRKEELGIRP